MFLEEMGKRIKDLRIKRSMSQTRLAELVGYKDKTAIAHIEAGRRDIPQSKLIAIAEALGTSPSYLLDGDADDGYYYDPDTAEIAEQMRNSEEMSMLFDAARDADPEDLKAIYNMLLALKRKERHDD